MKNIFFILPLLFFSCSNKKNEHTTYIRGKVVNPRTEKAIISHDIFVLEADTLYFSNNNNLKGKVNCNEEGLFFLLLHPEYQTIYLKPGDSLAFHINVDEFDESLSFSGSLGFENNLLIDLFLVYEDEMAYFQENQFNFSIDSFSKKLDSFNLIKYHLIDDYQEELKQTTQKFRDILETLNHASNYTIKEFYLKKQPDVDTNNEFFNYDEVLKKELPDPNIVHLYTFSKNYFNRKSKDNNNKYIYISQLIDKEVKDMKFKENLLFRYCKKYIKENMITQIDSTVKNYLNLLENPLYNAKCKELIDKNKQLSNGKQFLDIQVLDLKNTTHHLTEYVIGHKSLLSFMDLNFKKNYISNLDKLKEIKKKYPDLQILIINLGTESYEEWSSNLPTDTNFVYLQVLRKDELKIIKPYHLSQVFLLKDNTIAKSLINMYHPSFNKDLEQFMLNKK